MSVINTNISALYSQDAMKTNARAQATAMQQLSTGSRVNSAKDDAAGLAIGQNMTSQIRGLNMAVRNLNDGVNMMQTAEGAMVESANMLQRMRELAVQAMNGTYSNLQRGYLDDEFQALGVQINRISTDTKWNDQALLNGALSGGVPSGAGNATFTFQAGKDAGQTITVTIGAMNLTTLGVPVSALGGGYSISTVTQSTDTLTHIEAALENINGQRALIGAAMNQMAYGADNLTNISSNATQSRSSIMDTDYALATTQLAKTQIISQAATAMLAQANQQPSAVMALLKG
jgi:flagellin